ncbi:MAG: hypothetical protein ACRECA_07395 [Pseudolabrys sp.]
MTDIRAAAVDPPALVYVISNGQIWPQLWFEPVEDHVGYWRGRIAAWHRLRGSLAERLIAARNFDALTILFPPPIELETA